MSTSAGTVIFNQDQSQVLLIKREDFQIWALPAGGIEPGEKPEAAAIREVYEETGFHIETDRYVGEYWRPQLPKGGDTMYIYTGHVVGGNVEERGPEAVAVEWFPPQALPKRTNRFHREMVMDALDSDKGSLKKTQTMPFAMFVFVRFAYFVRDLRDKLFDMP